MKEVKSRLDSSEKWEELYDYDFVVATPQCVSPGLEGVSEPPKDLFDLVLMDEAHHSEAPRWADILSHYSEARQLLFTATPFRRDKKEIRGKIVYFYPVRLAHEDGIFGKIRFVAVDPPDDISHDVAVARQTETLHRIDREAELDHRVMVRTDSKKKADELAKIYEEETSLRLRVVHSGHTSRHVERTLKKLLDGELDGIICVAMLGEGFDFPQLKIAAIHAPHKSLAVTLQFIGRFARTSGERLGEAKFVAVSRDIRMGTDDLYRESAAWQDIVENLSSARVEEEVRIKEIAASFNERDLPNDEAPDVVMSDFKPYFHVKIYKLEDEPDLSALPEFAKGVLVLRHEVSSEFNSSLILLKQVTRPKWTSLDQFSRVEHELVVLFYDPSAGLLFISSSRRTLNFYRILEDFYGNGNATLLSNPRVSRVLADLERPEFFSVGLKNSVQNSNTESYVIKSGPSAHRSISPTDGLTYQRGHVFGKGEDQEGKEVTIGYSSSSKVWSNTSGRVGSLIEWCQLLSKKLATTGVVTTGTALDHLQTGDEISELPEGVIGVGWCEDVYKKFPRARVRWDSQVVEMQLLDLDITLLGRTENHWDIGISHGPDSDESVLRFSLSGGVANLEWHRPAFAVTLLMGDEEIELIDYLKHHPLTFYLGDFSRVEGSTLFQNRASASNLAADQVEAIDWGAEGIDIELEVNPAGLDLAQPVSVQDGIGARLTRSNCQVALFDHGTGEMADFVTLTKSNDDVMVTMYHVKGSGGNAPGDRVDDAYEVCGQVVKCLIWLKTKALLRKRILERIDRQCGESRLLKGSRNDVMNILADDLLVNLGYRIVVVQPGIPAASISEKIGHVLAAASDYVRRASSAEMRLICSP